MKKILLLLASAALLFAGCAKEVVVDNVSGDEMVDVTFTAQIQGEELTRAAVDEDGQGIYANRCIMVLYYNGNEYGRDTAAVSGDKANFNLKLPAKRTYKAVFWADCATETLGDLYYNTGDLTNITLKTAYVGNDDARDAFFAANDYTIEAQTTNGFTATLKRPFAQINVISKDIEALHLAALYPQTVNLSFAAPTSFNAMSGECEDVQTIDYEANVYKAYDSSKEQLTLSMDYLFAGSRAAVDIDFSAPTEGTMEVEYSFTNIPYERNYRTNIIGNLLTADASWEVTIAPSWKEPDYDVPYYEASSIQDAQNYIAPSSTGTEKNKSVDLSNATITTDDIDEDNTIKFELTPTSPVEMVNFTLPAIPQDLVVAGCIGWKITYDHVNGYPTQNVNVTAPMGTSVSIEAPESHVTLNGTVYNQVTATTGDGTLVVPAGVTVDSLFVKKGAVEIHGTVNHLSVTPDVGETVVFKDCENLGDDVYAVAKQHIAEGYVADDATNSIVKKDFVQDENGVWHVMNAKAYNEFAAAVNSGVAFEGKTVVLDEDIDFQNAVVTPIGNFTDNTPFKGIFNGNNKKLSNITVQNVVGKMGVGIFGKVYAPCVIKNLVVEGATVIGDKETAGDKAIAYVGGIVGHGYANIQNCTFKGDIYAGHQIGGIAGSGGFTITSCTFEGNIISERYWGLGGIIGNCQDGGAISGNSAKGTISAKGSDPLVAGGIIGAPLYTTYEVKNNYAGISMSYNGESFENVYPIVGVYNEDAELTATDFEKLTFTLANNTWDKTISSDESYAILYHSSNLTPTGYFINYGAATAKPTIAMIGDTKYSSLSSALENASDNDVVVLCKDLVKEVMDDKSDRETYVVSGKTITLDLNGHTIKHRYGLNKSGLFEVKNSIFTIDDSSVEKNGKIADTYAQAVLSAENSDVYLKNGILAAEYSSTSSTNYRVVKLKNTNFTMDGGSVIAATTGSYNRAFEFVHSTGTNSNVIVNNGTIKTFTSYAVVFYGDSGGYQGENNTVEINGGEISTQGNYGWLGDDLFGEITMNGGSFTSNWHQVVDANTKFTYNGGTINLKTN